MIEPKVWPRVLWAALALALAADLITFFYWSARLPHGGWDAWAIWNLRAKFLYLGGHEWRDAFSRDLSWSHPDYPLLVPALVARCWVFVGSDTTAAPILIALLFTFVTIGLLYASLSVLAGRQAAILGSLLLLATPAFVRQGANQYADVPLSFFVLATLVLLCFQDHRFRVLAGVSAGLAAWTKNEGLLFLGSVVLARMIVASRFGPWKQHVRSGARFVVGLAPVLLILVYFKVSLAGPNFFLHQDAREIWQKLLDPSRYLTVTHAVVTEMAGFGGLVISPLLVIGIYLMCMKVKLDAPKAVATVLPLLLTAAGDLLIYVISPGDLGWLLDNSLERLLLQLWPAAIFACMLVAGRGDRLAIPAIHERKKARGQT